MESFNWPEALTGLVIRGGLWWHRAQIYGSQGVLFAKLTAVSNGVHMLWKMKYS